MSEEDGSRYLDLPRLGAVPETDGVSTDFRVWAPRQPDLSLTLFDAEGASRTVPFEAEGDGYLVAVVEEAPPGTRYRYVTGDGRVLADPASRSQPEGVNGPSEVFDPGIFSWTDDGFAPEDWRTWVVYELHVGTFSAGGNLEGAAQALGHLVELGVNAVELMPICPFPGTRNWGYDGVFPYAVQNSYGGPRALQQFIDGAHRLGLAVVLDVVYNHVGPEGNVLSFFAPYFTDRYQTPWGPAMNFDGPESDHVRRYFASNALEWLRDFHVDALRLDAIHSILDTTARPFLLELGEATRELERRAGRRSTLIAESADNNPKVVSDSRVGGTELDSQWNDDFHHALHAVATGERNGYYVDFGRLEQLSTSIAEGFVLQGGYSSDRRRRHGASSRDIDPEHFVVFAQNHDQVGNRPRGNRLATQLDTDRLRLIGAVVLLSPYVPLLFMGEEYAETAPFPFFVDHGDEELLEAVRRGRAQEMRDLGFTEEPLDPTSEKTFEMAKVNRDLRNIGDHARVWTAYRELIMLRRIKPALARSTRSGCWSQVTGGSLLGIYRRAPQVPDEAVVFCNFGSDPALATPPPSPGLEGWSKLADSALSRFGGMGTELLPDKIEDGDRVTISAGGFCVYGA